MTKIYIKPETKTYQVELHLMQDTSFYKDDSDENKVTNEEEVLGKEFSFGFFEQEELDNE